MSARFFGAVLVGASLCFALGSVAFGSIAFYIGEARDDPPVVKPPEYVARTGEVALVVHGFDTFPQNVDVQGCDLGGVWMTSPGPLLTDGDVYGERPGSLPHAVAVVQPGQWVRFELAEPAATFGLLVLGLDVAAVVEVRSPDGAMLEQVDLPAPGVAGSVWWFGLTCDAAWIVSVQLAPGGADEYGFDDLEYGLISPEPASFGVMIAGGLAVLAAGRAFRRSRGVRQGSV